MTVRRVKGKWIVDFRLPSGERVRRVSPVQSKRAAHQLERELRDSLTCERSSLPERTLRDFAVEWLQTYAVVNNKPSEVISKESILRVHLLPFFEKRMLDSVTTRDVEQYKAEKLRRTEKKKGLAPGTINNHLVVLQKMLRTALEWGLIGQMPVIRRLKVPQADFDWLTAEESDRFLEAIEAKYPQWKALFWTALRTGMRRGEIFGLHWDDVDLVARTVTVRHSVFRGKLGTPKSGRNRTIPMTLGLTAALKEQRAASMLRTVLVFPGSDGGLSKHQDHVDRPLHGALKKAGLRRIKFHELRHSFASQLVSAGRPIREVQELLGHATIQMTMRYAHLAPERMREAVDALEVRTPRDDRAAG